MLTVYLKDPWRLSLANAMTLKRMSIFMFQGLVVDLRMSICTVRLSLANATTLNKKETQLMMWVMWVDSRLGIYIHQGYMKLCSLSISCIYVKLAMCKTDGNVKHCTSTWKLDKLDVSLSTETNSWTNIGIQLWGQVHDVCRYRPKRKE